MGKGSRNKRNRANQNQVKKVEDILAPQSYSGYSGANFSRNRARIVWPTLDSRKELDSFSRAELVRRSRWLYANTGIVKRLVDGLSEMVGYLTPQAITSDTDWNEKAEKLFKRFAASAAVFDIAGKFDFFSAQLLMTRSAIKDGDMLTVLTETKSGIAQCAFYETHQLVSIKGGEKEQWIDGVRVSRNGRHLAYGIRNYNSPKAEPFVVSARDSIYFGKFDASGHVRAVPRLSHGVNTVADITEIYSDVKGAIKTSGLSGVVRTRKENANPSGNLPGITGRTNKVLANRGGVIKEEESISIKTEDVYAGNQIQDLNPGEDLKVIADPRPHENQRQLISDLIRDLSWGIGVAPEVSWHTTGLTGPGVRIVLEQADRWVKSRQKDLEEWCQRYWVYFLSKEMKAGRLLKCEDEDWWAVSWLPQRSMTIDRGAVGRQRLDEIASGAAPLANWTQEAYGMHWKDSVDQTIKERAYKEQQCALMNVDVNKAFPPRQGAAVINNSDEDLNKGEKMKKVEDDE